MTCSQINCLSCVQGYQYLNSTSICKLTCADSNCIACSVANISLCLQCISSNFYLVNGTCIKSAHCGDGIITPTKEECDDGNTNNHDGCSSLCTVEQYYQCTTQTSVQGFTYTLYCSYTHPIDLTVISI
jgi:cysteine-rich repeat protein